jgi:hypothetical protein
MTRTTPDHAFAEAAKAELLRRARVSREQARNRSSRPSRGIWRQAAITAGVAALIVGVLAGTGVLRTVLTPTPPAASTPTDSRVARPAPAPALIAPPGYHPRTDAQLRAWGETVPNPSGIDRATWIRQQILITHCMAAHGFLYDPIYRYEHAMGSLPPGHEESYEAALHGSNSNRPTSWRTLGCTGLAEHETGHDPNP